MPDHKTVNLKALAIEHGWQAAVLPDTSQFNGDPKTIQWNFYAKRTDEGKDEKVVVRYQGDLLVSATYVYGKYRLIPARLAGVMRLITGKPDPRKYDGTAAKQEPLRSVPFSVDSPAIDILKGVLDKTVTYQRRIDNEEKEEDVPGTNRTSKHFRVIESPPHSGRRILEFTNRTGFHAVALDQIVNVS